MINNVSKFNSILQGNRLILRQILPTELEEKYIDWMNDPELVQYMESRFHIYSRFDLEKYVNHINEDGSSIMWGIYESDTLEYIGNIKLGSIDWNHRFGDIGLIIGERKSWGKGYATESILLVCDFGFHNHNHRLMLFWISISQSRYLTKTSLRSNATHWSPLL